jgi:hypothetical protein
VLFTLFQEADKAPEGFAEEIEMVAGDLRMLKSVLERV